MLAIWQYHGQCCTDPSRILTHHYTDISICICEYHKHHPRLIHHALPLSPSPRHRPSPQLRINHLKIKRLKEYMGTQC
jgi:hypothetical protein